MVEVKDDNGNSYPIAWILMRNDLSLGPIHVEQKFRRIGISQIILTKYVDQLFQDERIQTVGINAFIDRQNHASMKLFQGLGWEEIKPVKWIKTSPQKAKI